jgi:inosine-uridine nucleoside N-ribohydrolase
MLPPVVLCCDPGLDDAWLIATLLGRGIDLRAVVVSYGCADVDQCLRTASGILRLAGREDIPLIRGAGQALGSNPVQDHPERFGGSNGFMDVALDPGRNPVIDGGPEVVAMAIRDVLARSCGCAFINTGPATTAALVERYFPGALHAHVGSIHVMGGALDGPGNCGTKRPPHRFGCAEFNVFNDAESFRLLLGLKPPSKLVTWDLRQVCLGRSLVSSHRARTPLGRALLEATARFFEIYGSDKLEDTGPEPVCSVIDVLAAFTLPGEGHFSRQTVAVTTTGEWYGETTRDSGGVEVDVFRPPPGPSLVADLLDLVDRCTSSRPDAGSSDEHRSRALQSAGDSLQPGTTASE